MGGIARAGLTGGIGSGKSTVAAMFSGFGMPVLDLDAVGRDLSARPDNIAMLASVFGCEILRADGSLDRRRLADSCFADAKKTTQLNRMMHPLIWREADAWFSRQQQAPYALIEASVLIESGGASRMDAVVVVLADEAVRRRRVWKGRHMNAGRFDAIVSRQCDDDARRAAADYIVENNGDLSALHAKVEALHRRMMARWSPALRY